MLKYYKIWGIWFKRLSLKHRVHCKNNHYLYLLVILPIILILFSYLLVEDTTLLVNKVEEEIIINKDILTVIPILSGIFITFTYNFKIKFHSNKKYNNLRKKFLKEDGKEESTKYSIFDEYLSFIEYSIQLLIICFFTVFMCYMSNNIYLYIFLVFIFLYSHIFTFKIIDLVLNRIDNNEV